MTERLWQAAAAGIPGAGFLVGGWAVDNVYFQTFLLISGGILLAIAGALLLAWLAFQAAEARHDWVRANSWNVECTLLHERRELTLDLRGVDELTKQIIIQNGVLGVSYRLFDDIPRVALQNDPTYEFLYEFIEASNDVFLCPIGAYSEGSEERAWAQALTAYFVRIGEAEPARGNMSARWKSAEIFRQYELLAKHENQ
jgi:hypothetical protein